MAHNKIDFRQIGSTGLDRQGGQIFEEQLRTLQQQNGIKTFKEMRDNDPVIGAVLFAIDMLMRQVSWRIEPASQENEDLEAANFIEGALNDMENTWQDTISEILSMLAFGWSFHEIVFKRRIGPHQRNPARNSRFDDGKIGWRNISIRAQDTLWAWEFNDNGSIKGMIQQGPPDFKTVFIPIEKAILFRTNSHKNNPEGRSVLRNAFRPWFFKKRIEEIEGIGIERDLAGLPVAWVPPDILDPNASAEDKAVLTEIKKIVRNVRRDEQEGIVFPLVHDDAGNKVYDFSLLSSGGRRQFNTNEIITRYDQRIAMTVLADFILLGHGERGSFALSSDKTQIFAVALGSWLDMIAGVMNAKAIPQLMDLNGMNIEKTPKLIHSDIETPNLEELGKYIANLSGAGAPLFPDQNLENALRRAANLPIRDSEDL